MCSSGNSDGISLLQSMQKIGGALGVRGCGKDGPLIALQHLEPGCEIGRVIVARLGAQGEIGGYKGSQVQVGTLPG